MMLCELLVWIAEAQNVCMLFELNEHERYRMPRGMHWNFHSIYTSSHALIRFRKFEIYDLILNPGD